MDAVERDLPHLIQWHSPDQLMPTVCVNSCRRVGFKYAGLQVCAPARDACCMPCCCGLAVLWSAPRVTCLVVQMGEECWCGNSFGRHGKADSGDCSSSCSGPASGSFACGGAFRNSIYWSKEPLEGIPDYFNRTVVNPRHAVPPGFAQGAATQSQDPRGMVFVPPDAVYVLGISGESCTTACFRASREWTILNPAASSLQPPERNSWGINLGKRRREAERQLNLKRTGHAQSVALEDSSLVCNEQLFPLLHSNCEALTELTGCERCMPAPDATIGFASPGVTISNNQCLLSKGLYLQCEATPPSSDYRRACVCQVVPRPRVG